MGSLGRDDHLMRLICPFHVVPSPKNDRWLSGCTLVRPVGVANIRNRRKSCGVSRRDVAQIAFHVDAGVAATWQ
jgi:hypothetical protein